MKHYFFPIMMYSFFITTVHLCYSAIDYEDKQKNALHDYFWANYFDHQNDKIRAKKKFSALTNVEKATTGSVQFLYKQGLFAEIIKRHQKNIDCHCKHSPTPRLQLAIAHQKVGNHREGERRLMELYEQYPFEPEVVIHLVEQYMDKKELLPALTIVDKYLNHATIRSSTFIFNFIKAQICMQLNRPKDALEQITLCVELQPHFDRGWLIKGILNEQIGNISSAIKDYQTYIETAVSPDLTIQKRIATLIERHHKDTPKNHEQPSLNRCYQLLADGKLHELDQIITSFFTTAPKESITEQWHVLKIQSLLHLKRYSEAVEAFNEALLDPQKNSLIIQLIRSLPHTNTPIVWITVVIASAQKKFPKSPVLHATAGEFYTKQGNYRAAIESYKHVIKNSTHKKIQSQAYFQIALLYNKQKQYESMLHALTNSRLAYPAFAPTNNLLAHYFATQKKQYKTALSFIEAAIAAEPSNNSYLQLKAKILTKEKLYTQAIQTVQDLIKQSPNDPYLRYKLAKLYIKQQLPDKAAQLIQYLNSSSIPEKLKPKITRIQTQLPGNRTV